MFYCIYRLSDQQFLRGAVSPLEFDPLTEGLQVYPKHLRPDMRAERFDAESPSRKRPATAQERNDYDAARQTQDEQVRFDQEQLVKAVAIWAAGKLNVPVGTARQEILAIYRGLS